MGHIVRGRDQSSAGNLVTGIQNARIADHAGFVLVIPARAVRNDCEKIIGLRLFHSREPKNILLHVVHVFLRRGAFQNAAQERVAVSRIIELRGRFRHQRVTGENLERFFHARKMPGAVLGDVSFSVGVVMPDASQVAEQLAGGDRPLLLRKRRAVFLYGRIEVQLSAFEKLHHRRRRDGFGNRAQTEECR